MQQIYKRTPMLQRDFNKVAKQLKTTLQHGCSSVNFLHIFRTTFLENTSEQLLLSRVFIIPSVSSLPKDIDERRLFIFIEWSRGYHSSKVVMKDFNFILKGEVRF